MNPDGEPCGAPPPLVPIFLRYFPVHSIPWQEAATMVRIADEQLTEGGRTIVAEGPLHRVLALADRLSPAELQRHFIALPDRRAAPFRFDADGITGLLGRIDRPGGSWGIAPV